MRNLVRLFSRPGMSFIICALVLPMSFAHASDIDSRGVSEPPFLAMGADSNLLMLIDNSGSMLDMAYVDDVGSCTDNTYDSTKTYTGLFDPDTWYQWEDGSSVEFNRVSDNYYYSRWTSGKRYTVGDIVYAEGAFYKATAITGTSDGSSVDTDSMATWVRIHEISVWRNNTTYTAGTFVQYDQLFYYTAAGGTSSDSTPSDGLSIDDDTGVVWEEVDSTLRNGQSYSSGNIVGKDGLLWIATASVTGSEDNFYTDVAAGRWVRLDEGHFVKNSGWTTIAEVKADFTAGTNEATYSQAELVIRIVSVSGVASGVTGFAAKGNLLNWASASKFDIQKKVLTGGKYNSEQQMLISESRGCSAHEFIKEVPLDSGGVLSFSIEGSQDDTRIDPTDDTARIIVWGVSDGFIGSDREAACKEAISCIASEYSADGCNQGSVKADISTCLAYEGTNNVLAESNAAYNHSIHSCWEMVTKDYDDPSDFGNVSELQNSCQHIYDNGVLPVTINYEDSGYVCNGLFDGTVYDTEREGYIGRCWETGSVPDGCLAKTCNYVDGTVADNYLGNNNQCFADGHVYNCPGNYNSVQGTCNKDWTLVLIDDPDNNTTNCDTTATATAGSWITAPNLNDLQGCIQNALWDYCQDVSINQVIDPSDETFDTGETLGVVGALTDSGMVSMFGTDHALIVMKGYIVQSDSPEGILHKYSGDLRMGAMAFNDNGSATECNLADPSDTVVEYCPADNKDGAHLISPIMLGTEVIDDNGTTDDSDDTYHIDDLVKAINAVRATAWTPLAEAYYTALGYFGQISDRRINDGPDADDYDFKTEAEGGDKDPIEYWCQNNDILIITEGASTADINQEVTNFVNSMQDTYGISDTTGDSLADGECLADDGTSSVYGSTYLDDLTYFAKNAPANYLYQTPQLEDEDGEFYDKQNISTFIVTTGSLRDDGTTSECNPYTIMQNAANNGGSDLIAGESPEDLETNLLQFFLSLRTRASAGSAASVVSSSRSGEGAVYQAIFWPKLTRSGSDVSADPYVVEWAGDVRALFLDSNGYLFDDSAAPYHTFYTEDDNGNGILDAGEDDNGNGILDGDRRVIVYYDSIAKTSKACYDLSVYDASGCTNGVDDLEDIDFIWSAGRWLANESMTTATNRSTYISNDRKRLIYTWNDLDNDGLVDTNGSGGVSDEWIEFVADQPTDRTSWDNMTIASSRSGIYTDFDVPTQRTVDGNVLTTTDAQKLAKVKDIINWVRGRDRLNDENIDENTDGYVEPAQRSRQTVKVDDSSIEVTWRLGDVIYSTPMTVGTPSEGYHLLYNDYSYAQFYNAYKDRRQVIYFGSNDGMFHAVNGGFYMAGDKTFCRVKPVDGDCNETGNYPELGAELWAYVPYNILPHLRGLTENDYKHKYFVDLRPRIFDVQIWDKGDSTHINGWGTIVVGGMRLGGAPINANELDGADSLDNREFISSYFIFDVTDPENPPVLLGELTRRSDEAYVDANDNGVWDAGETFTDRPDEDGDYDNTWTASPDVDMGHSTNISTMVVMKESTADPNSEGNQWYLILGSGPHGDDAMKGVSDQAGKVAVIPLDWLIDANSTTNTGTKPIPDRVALRIPDDDPTNSTNYGGRFLLPDYTLAGETVSASETAFVSDGVTIDFDIDPSTLNYMSDVVYFGTVEGTFVDDGAGNQNWTGGGKFLRLITRDFETGLTTSTYGRAAAAQVVTTPDEWKMNVLMDVGRPVTTAMSIGYDSNNFWLYAGTGRFWDADDKRDESQQAYYGIKEPMTRDSDNVYRFLWSMIPAPDLDLDLANNSREWPEGNTYQPGSKGLLRVDEIQVREATASTSAFLSCNSSNDGATGLGCLPYELQGLTNPSLYHLEEYIAGNSLSYSNSADGWYKEFYPDHNDRQRNLGQPTLLGGLLTFTTYQPYSSVCQAEGVSYLYGVYYKTGTSWYEAVFGSPYGYEADGINISNQLSLGQGLAETPNLFVGQGEDGAVSAYVQTSTGEVKGISIENLPVKTYYTGRAGFRSCGP